MGEGEGAGGRSKLFQKDMFRYRRGGGGGCLECEKGGDGIARAARVGGKGERRGGGGGGRSKLFQKDMFKYRLGRGRG